MYLKIQGLVLRVTDYNDTDTLLTLLTADYGKITAKVRGLRRKNSPLAAACQLLVLGEYTLFSYKGSYTVNEAHSIALFEGLRRDLQKLSLGTYFAQVAEILSQEDMQNPALLSLTLNCLYALSELSLPEMQVKAVFELRSACLAGYMPDLSGCLYCGNPFPDRFDVTAGHLECYGCRNQNEGGLRLPLTPGILDTMRYIQACDSKMLFRFEAAPATLEQLAQITEAYLSTQLERGFSTLDFYKSLLI